MILKIKLFDQKIFGRGVFHIDILPKKVEHFYLFKNNLFYKILFLFNKRINKILKNHVILSVVCSFFLSFGGKKIL